MLRRIIAALVIGAAALTPAAASAETYGAAISPVPLIVENWAEPAVSIENRGELAIDVALVIEGDGYALAADAVSLEAKGRADIPLTAIGPGEAVVTATVSTDVPGTDRAVLVLRTNVRHRSALEALPWPLILLLLVAAVLVVLWAVNRRLWRGIGR